MRFVLLFPVALTITGFVLSFLCIFAGNKPGFMNDYQIVTLNTSKLGHNLIPNVSPAIPTQLSSLFPTIPTEVTGLTNEINGLIGTVADQLSEELGIKQWYGWHILNFCEGNYRPNSTAHPAHFNVTDCSTPTPHFHFKISDIINSQLLVGPLHITLEDLKWPDDIQKEIDQLDTAIPAALALYIISVIASGASIITGLTYVYGSYSLILTAVNWALAGLSFLSLFIASIIISVVNARATKTVNDKGNGIGVYAYKGKKYLALTWISMVVMLIALSIWSMWLCAARSRKNQLTEKRQRTAIFGRFKW